MITNLFKTAWRHLRRNPFTSLINVGGLALGMAVAMIIGLWIRGEWSFNKNFRHYRQISQVMITGTFSGEISTDPVCPVPLADELSQQFASDLEKVVLTTRTESHVFSYGDKRLSSSGNFAQAGFADLFSANAVAGTVAGLEDPTAILISASLARSLFGSEEAVGKLIKIDQQDNLLVAGVYADFSASSFLSGLDFVASWNYYRGAHPGLNQRWNNCHYFIYVQLRDGLSNDVLSAKAAGLLKTHLPDINPVVLLHPMSKWHLYETFKNGYNTGGQIQYVRMFGMVATFVLLLACINFMNLSTARSEKRAREVGVLKAIGSGKAQLVYRFLAESVATAALAFLISLVLVWLSLPWFNELTRTRMEIPASNTLFWIISLAFVLFTGFVAGCYPAFYLSAFQPVKVLKGSFKAGRAATVPRKVLVVVQFFSSIVLVIATLIVLKQLDFARNRPLGYASGGLLHVPAGTAGLRGHEAALRHELLQSGAVLDVASSSSPVNQLTLSSGGYAWEGKDAKEEAIFGTVAVTEDFGSTVQWTFKEGRNFSRNFVTDSSAVIINEMAARYMGVTHPLGKRLFLYEKPYRIIGVIGDAVMGSPFVSVSPIAFFLGGKSMTDISSNLSMDHMTLRLSPRIGTRQALEKVKAIFTKYNPEAPFEYDFVDQQYAKQFRSVETTGTLASIFAVLAISISCLGLYALASFIAEQRTKEMGIRKVLGASVFGLWRLLSTEFILLTGIAFLLAIPVAYWGMDRWLENYVYRITISWEVFALTGVMGLLLTLLTISFQAVRAALTNPAKSLRDE